MVYRLYFNHTNLTIFFQDSMVFSISQHLIISSSIICYFGEYVNVYYNKLLYFSNLYIRTHTHTHVQLLVSLYKPTLMQGLKGLAANVSYCCFCRGRDACRGRKIRIYRSWLVCWNHFSMERKTKNSSCHAGEAVRTNLVSNPRIVLGPLTNGPAMGRMENQLENTTCNLMWTVNNSWLLGL